MSIYKGRLRSARELIGAWEGSQIKKHHILVILDLADTECLFEPRGRDYKVIGSQSTLNFCSYDIINLRQTELKP